jgi:TIR domain/zinc-ribbon domain
MGHIFISYSRRDKEFVDRMSQALELYGFPTWKDVKAITGGDVWKAAISKAVRECDAFLIVLSPQSTDSENVSKELAVATKHARRILPVMYQACRIPDKMEYDLAELQWADFAGPPFDEALDGLVRALGGRPSADLAGSHQVQALRDFVVAQTNRLKGFAVAAQAPEPMPSPAGPNRFCISCGASLRPGNAFCIECGAQL